MKDKEIAYWENMSFATKEVFYTSSLKARGDSECFHRLRKQTEHSGHFPGSGCPAIFPLNSYMDLT